MPDVLEPLDLQPVEEELDLRPAKALTPDQEEAITQSVKVAPPAGADLGPWSGYGIGSPVGLVQQHQAEAREVTKTAVTAPGKALDRLGKGLVGGVADIGYAVTGERNEGDIAPNLKAGLLGELMPAETERQFLPPVARGVLSASQGLIETAPKLALVAAAGPSMAAQSLASGVLFGLTPDGTWDWKQGAPAAMLPFVGKASGALVEAIAAKLGVTKDAALRIFNRMGGATGAAGYIGTIQASEIAAMPPEQREGALIDALGTVVSQAALGMLHERTAHPDRVSPVQEAESRFRGAKPAKVTPPEQPVTAPVTVPTRPVSEPLDVVEAKDPTVTPAPPVTPVPSTVTRKKVATIPTEPKSEEGISYKAGVRDSDYALAVRLGDGTVVHDKNAGIHALVLENKNIPRELWEGVQDAGVVNLKTGEYIADPESQLKNDMKVRPVTPVTQPAPAVPIPSAEALAKPAVESLSDSTLEFQRLFSAPISGKGGASIVYAVPAGMGAKTVADLNAFAAMRRDLVRRMKDKSLPAAEQFDAMGKAQYPREAIEVATHSGGWGPESTVKLEATNGPRPLDWREHPEVAEWLKQHGSDLGIALPDELKAAPAVAPAPAEPAKKPDVAPLGPLLEVPKSAKGLAAERTQIVRLLETLEEADAKTGELSPKDGQEDRVSKLRARLATIEQAMLPQTAAAKEAEARANEVLAEYAAGTWPSTDQMERVNRAIEDVAKKHGTDPEALKRSVLWRPVAAPEEGEPLRGLEAFKQRTQDIFGKPAPKPPGTTPAPKPTPTVEVPAKQRSGFAAKQAKAQKKFLLAEADKAETEAPTKLPVVDADADAALIERLRSYESGDTEETFAAKREQQLAPLFQKYNIPATAPAYTAPLSVEGLALNAPSRAAGPLTMPERYQLVSDAVQKARFEQLPKVTIDVPGDGTFSILNDKASLKEFRARAAKFPTTAPKAAKPSTARESESKPAAVGKLDAESAFNAASLAVATETDRFVITHVWSDGASTVGVDGRRLIRIKHGAGGTAKKPLIKTPDGAILKNVKFPDWRQVVPDSKSLVVVAKDLDTARLFTVLKQAEQVLTERSISILLLRNPDGSVGVSAQSPDVGEYSHNIGEGARVIAAVQPGYLIDAINAARMVGDEKVTLESQFDKAGPTGATGLTPLVIRSASTESVIMPMRLEGLPEGATGLTRRDLAPKRQAKPVPPVSEDLPSYTEIGHGGETAAEMRGAALSAAGLPPSVPDRGPGFAAELLEASRQLDALVRYRGTLRPGVLGQFVRARGLIANADKIEVGDISNQGTVAHEIGHALDANIWPSIFNSTSRGSQRSLADRAKTGTPKELHAELVAVSVLMRGPITGSHGHQKYRRSATELIADYVSLYLHDPETATRLAPKWSAGFEIELAKNPEAKGIIHQVLNEGLTPTPPEGSPTGPAATPSATPGAVPSRETPAKVKRDAPLVIASEELVKGQLRKYKEEIERARVKADGWHVLVPDKGERGDVGAFVEGIGNIELAGDTIADVRARMTPAMNQLAKLYRYAIELQRQRLNEFLKFLDRGDYLKFLMDYLPHFYVNGKSDVQSALGRFIKDSPNAKRRTLPTLQEAVDLGLKPITQDPAVLYEHTAKINWRVATNRAALGRLKEMKTTGGDPIVLPAKDAPAGWPITNNPLVQQVYAHPTASGDLLLWRGGAAIHPDAWRAVRQMLETPTSSDLGKAYDAVNAFTRANAFAFSLFHDVTLRSASLGASMRWYNPVRGLFRLLERNPLTGELETFRSTRGIGKELLQDEAAVADAASAGLQFSWTDSESYQKNAREALERLSASWRGKPFIGNAAALARDIQHMRQKGLWKNTHDALKIVAYNDLVAKALQDAPSGTDSKLVRQQVASLLNDAFGGQEWQTKFWLSPQVRQAVARFILAPDWTLSTLRSVPGLSDAASVVRGQSARLGRGAMPTGTEGKAGNFGRARFWGGEIAALAMATLAAQYAIYQLFGDKNKGDKEWVWENESGQDRRVDATPLIRRLPWHKTNDPTRYYINLGKRPEEILGWVVHPEQNALSKMARPVAEVFRQVTGTEGDFKAQWKRDHESFLESLPARGKSILGQAVPFTFSGNQFAMSLPYRKGMTSFKAQQAYESAYEIVAEPSRLKMILRGGHTGIDTTPQTLVDLVTDAARRNGVPAEVVRRKAQSVVRGKYYADYFKAWKSGDQKGLEKAVLSLQRLGATAQGLEKSMEKHEQAQPRATVAPAPPKDVLDIRAE